MTYEAGALCAVIHLELDRMGSVLEADQLLHLQLRVAVKEVIVEHPTSLEEITIFFEVAERFTQRAADRRDLLELLRRQVVEVLVDGWAGIELILDAVKARHQHGRKSEIGICQRI